MPLQLAVASLRNKIMFLASSKDLNFKENKDNENDPPNLGHGGERET